MAIKYEVDHIPRNTPFNRRPGHLMAATTITIHNTGNSSSSAKNERAWLTNPSNNRTASYHIVVDEHGAIECIPLTENAWHAGDGSGATSGNRTSIGIEICESGDYSKTLDNAVELVASMLKQRGWGVDRLRRHFDWSGKICPRLMYDGGRWTAWEQFKARVANKLKEGETMTAQERADFIALEFKVEQQAKRIEELEALHKQPVPEWATDAVNEAVRAGLIDTPNGRSKDFYALVTVMHRNGMI